MVDDLDDDVIRINLDLGLPPPAWMTALISASYMAIAARLTAAGDTPRRLRLS
jgi:hypothetical protein